MAYHFHGNQFEESYKPTRLRNWEVPKWYPEWPQQNVGKTAIISNDRGNLLPGVPRGTSNPWGNFLGTWHYPKRITRKTANELSATPQYQINLWKQHCQNLKCKLGHKCTYKKKEKVIQPQPKSPEVAESQPSPVEEIEPPAEDETVDVSSDDKIKLDKTPLCPIHDCN